MLAGAGQEAAASAVVQRKASEYAEEYGVLERGMKIGIQPHPDAAAPAHCIAPDDIQPLLALLLTLPHGALKYSHAVEGLVETSNNVASVQPDEAASTAAGATSVSYTVVTASRSSMMHALEAVRDR